MRVTNRHTATVCGIAPGAEGEVRENNPGVAGLLKAGFLVPVEAKVPQHERGDYAAVCMELDMVRGELVPTREALRVAEARIATQVTAFDTAWAERERAYAAELAQVRELLQGSEARITAFEAEVAQLRTELEEATRPPPSAPGPSDTPSPPVAADPPKPARVRREG